jgi:hypothetical protein
MLHRYSKVRITQAASALAVAVALAAAAGAAYQPQIPRPEPRKEQKEVKPIHGEGCVAAGVEARCLVVRDLKTGHLYGLLFKEAPPPVGLGIEFTGVPHTGPTHCMQGIPVDVTSWSHKASIKCAPGQAGRR